MKAVLGIFDIHFCIGSHVQMYICTGYEY